MKTKAPKRRNDVLDKTMSDLVETHDALVAFIDYPDDQRYRRWELAATVMLSSQIIALRLALKKARVR